MSAIYSKREENADLSAPSGFATRQKSPGPTYQEPTLPHDLCETGVAEVVLLQLVSSGLAAVSEGVEVADLTEERPGANDAEANPDAPDDAAQDVDDLVAEERWEGEHEHDAYRDGPSARKTGLGERRRVARKEGSVQSEMDQSERRRTCVGIVKPVLVRLRSACGI